MSRKYILDILTQDNVSIKFINEENAIHRKAYINSETGRQEVIEELPIEIQSEIFYIWGGVATIEEVEIPIDDTPQPPTTEEVLADLINLLTDKGVIF